MTIRQLIDKIISVLPASDRTNELVFGNGDAVCTGIVTAVTPTIDIIRKAVELHANLIITHEPTFYSDTDDTGLYNDDAVVNEKLRLLRDNGIAVWRSNTPTNAYLKGEAISGLAEAMGWATYDTVETPDYYIVTIPETTVRTLSKELKDTLGLNAVRVIGNIDGKCSKVAVGGYICKDMGGDDVYTKLLDKVDVLIPYELIDWSTCLCARDAGQLGMEKAIIHLGHFSTSAPDMKVLANRIQKLDTGIPVTYVDAGDLYQYV